MSTATVVNVAQVGRPENGWVRIDYIVDDAGVLTRESMEIPENFVAGINNVTPSNVVAWLPYSRRAQQSFDRLRDRMRRHRQSVPAY